MAKQNRRDNPVENGSDIFNLKEAAAYLGYTDKGLREIVDRSRAAAQGQRTRGPLIKFFQPGRWAQIRFRREWLEAFIKRHTVDPTNAPANPASRQHKTPTSPSSSPAAGLDEAYFDI